MAATTVDPVLEAASRVVHLVEPPREEEYCVPKTRREAHERLDSLVVRCRWLASLDCMTENGWAAAHRTAEKLLDFIFEGHEDEDPRSHGHLFDLRLV